MNKPHDHLFKSTFSGKRIAADYIRHFLPAKLTAKLNLSSLELAPTSYVNGGLEEYLSDVVYSVGTGNSRLVCRFYSNTNPNPMGLFSCNCFATCWKPGTSSPKRRKGWASSFPLSSTTASRNGKEDPLPAISRDGMIP